MVAISVVLCIEGQVGDNGKEGDRKETEAGAGANAKEGGEGDPIKHPSSYRTRDDANAACAAASAGGVGHLASFQTQAEADYVAAWCVLDPARDSPCSFFSYFSP